MAAFNRDQAEAISTAIEKLFNRVRCINRIELSHDDMLELFVDPHDRQMAKDAPHLFHANFNTGVTVRMDALGTHGALTLLMFSSIDTGVPPAMPKSPAIRHSANPELVERLNKWFEFRTKTGLDFARAKALFGYLNEKCGSKQQVRYYWPSVIALCQEGKQYHAELGDIALKLYEARPSAARATLPLDIREACRSTSQAITTALLLEDIGDPVRPPVEPLANFEGIPVNEGTLKFEPF